MIIFNWGGGTNKKPKKKLTYTALNSGQVFETYMELGRNVEKLTRNIGSERVISLIKF